MREHDWTHVQNYRWTDGQSDSNIWGSVGEGGLKKRGVREEVKKRQLKIGDFGVWKHDFHHCPHLVCCGQWKIRIDDELANHCPHSSHVHF